jgi:signal transduction histidine kinase
VQALPETGVGRRRPGTDEHEHAQANGEPTHPLSVARPDRSAQGRSGDPPVARWRGRSHRRILDSVTDPAFRTLSEAVLAITAERSVDAMLQTIVDTARSLAHARYAALGIPDDEGGFAQFITSGMSQKAIEAIGPLPRQHGLLDAMLHTPRSERLPNIQNDPRFGGWPGNHPSMKSFLGVSIVAKGEVIAAFYLANRRGAAEFTDYDQELIETLAAHAAIAIENARLYERSRELSIVEERNRLARELHDSVTQTLFSMSLTAESAATLSESDPAQAKEQILVVRHLATEALQEMRSLIFELRPAELEAEGLVATLRKRVDVLRRVYHQEIELDVRAERRLDPETEKQLFRIVQEALHNALRHSQGTSLAVELSMQNGQVVASVSDDGIGFDPEAARHRSGRLGLTSMQERAQELGGQVDIRSRPGAGTEVHVEVPGA